MENRFSVSEVLSCTSLLFGFLLVDFFFVKREFVNFLFDNVQTDLFLEECLLGGAHIRQHQLFADSLEVAASRFLLLLDQFSRRLRLEGHLQQGLIILGWLPAVTFNFHFFLPPLE